ncbi:MAG: hypothetical protein FIA97_06485 [Methylococcaceae bacterium]|nr:hypothetical protein [Methylococcaceae bacterium]
MGGDKPWSFTIRLSELGLLDLSDEQWNLHGRGTYISNSKSAFPDLYANVSGTPNSLSPDWRRSHAATVRFYAALKAWFGAEFYMAPELIAGCPLSELKAWPYKQFAMTAVPLS